MRIRIGDTVYVDSDMKLPFVVDSISKNGFAYSADGKCYPAYRLGTKGQTFAFALGIRMNKKYKVDDYPYGIYIVRERGVYEIVNGVEHDITNRLMETPLKEVLLKKKEMTEDGWVRIQRFSFKVSDTSGYTAGNYSIFV